MNLSQNPAIKAQLAFSEQILFSIQVKKKNKWGKNQGRTICITDQHVYIFGGKNPTLHRKIDLYLISAFTRGSECDDFILHVKNDYDT